MSSTTEVPSTQATPLQVIFNQATLVSSVQSRSNQLPPMAESMVLSRFGLYGLSSTQEHVLRELPVCCLLSTVQLFHEWVEDGRYEFCELSFAFKSYMNEQDLSTLQQLDEMWRG